MPHVLLLRRTSPKMAPRVVPLLRIIMSAIGAEPDMRHYLALVYGGATDPRARRFSFGPTPQESLEYGWWEAIVLDRKGDTAGTVVRRHLARLT
jgi:hypothetical protein